MYSFIEGGISIDKRGQIRYVNEFDMTKIRRFYLIKNSDHKIIRGWRAHKVEERWFFVVSGSFIFNLVKIDNWISPSRELEIIKLDLEGINNKILHVPAGYGTAFQAKEDGSELLVFADHSIEHAEFDNYTYDPEYFVNLT